MARRVVLSLVAFVVGLALPTFLLLADIEVVAYHLPPYRKSFEAAGTPAATGLTSDQLVWTLTRVLDYGMARRPDLQFDRAEFDAGPPGRPAFMTIEIDHMVDVRSLFGLARTVRGAALGLALAGAAALWVLDRRGGWARLARGLITGAAVFLLGWAALAAFAVIDFNAFWTLFHETLFTNELWLLPEDSLLIQMLPESLFRTLALEVVGLLTVELVVIFGLSGFSLRRRTPGEART
jgi:integral membrane protein (TIGR01906 family)